VPYGEAVTPEKLSMIERAEDFLRDQGFREVRVRHHELANGHLARIELGIDEIPAALPSFNHIAEALRQIGYAHVTLDMQGYRRGSLNLHAKPTN